MTTSKSPETFGACVSDTLGGKWKNNRSENKNWMQNPISSAQYQVPPCHLFTASSQEGKKKKAEKVLTVSGRSMVLTPQPPFPLQWSKKAAEGQDQS